MFAEICHNFYTLIAVALLGLLYYILFIPVCWKDVNKKIYHCWISCYNFLSFWPSRMTQVTKNQLWIEHEDCVKSEQNYCRRFRMAGINWPPQRKLSRELPNILTASVNILLFFVQQILKKYLFWMLIVPIWVLV